MKKLFVLCIWSLISLFGNSQIDSVQIYHWTELKKCNPDTIYGLSFEKMKLDKVPKELAAFKQLKYLSVGKNRLLDLPDFIGDLANLQVLDLSKNKFENFPIEICRLTNLEKLIANRNPFDKIPECIAYCEKLEVIDLWNTPVMTFPVSISTLKNLKEIDLQGVKYGPKFQKSFQEQIPWVIIKFDPPCDCMD